MRKQTSPADSISLCGILPPTKIVIHSIIYRYGNHFPRIVGVPSPNISTICYVLPITYGDRSCRASRASWASSSSRASTACVPSLTFLTFLAFLPLGSCAACRASWASSPSATSLTFLAFLSFLPLLGQFLQLGQCPQLRLSGLWLP